MDRPAFEQLEERLAMAAVAWDGGGGNNLWFNPLNWTNNQIPTAVDDVTISVASSNPEIVLSGGSTTVKSLTLKENLKVSSGSLTVTGFANITGTAKLTVLGTMGFGSGQMLGPAATVVGSGGVLNILGSFKLARGLTNAGSLNWTTGAINAAGGSITNQAAGVMNVKSPSSFSGVGAKLTNAGTINRSVPGTTTIAQNAVFNNLGLVKLTQGTLKVLSGGAGAGAWNVTFNTTLVLGGDSYTMAGTAAISGAGTLQVLSGAHTFDGASSSITKLVIDGGSLAVSSNLVVGTLVLAAGTLTGSAITSVTGSMTWLGGSMTGTGRTSLTSQATLAISGGAAKTLARTLDNGGTGTWSGGQITFNGGTIINAAGRTLSRGGAGDLAAVSAGGTNAISSAGTIRKTGTGTVTLSQSGTGVRLNNSGTVQVLGGTLAVGGGGFSAGDFATVAGSILAFSGHGHTLAAGSSVSGAGILRFQGGTQIIVGQVSGSTVSITGGLARFDTVAHTVAKVNLAGGQLGGNAPLTISKSLNWSAGTMAAGASTTIALGASVTMQGSGDLELRRHLVNKGFALWTDGDLHLRDAVIENAPGRTFQITAAGTMFNDPGSNSILNKGNLVKSGNGLATIRVPITQTGTVTVNGGTLQTVQPLLDNHGTVRVNSGDLVVAGGFRNFGTLSIGSVSAMVTIQNNFVQTGGATVQVDVGGVFPSDYGRLKVNGKSTLTGTLEVALKEGFEPPANTTYEIISSASGEGKFEDENVEGGFIVTYLPLGGGVRLDKH